MKARRDVRRSLLRPLATLGCIVLLGASCGGADSWQDLDVDADRTAAAITAARNGGGREDGFEYPEYLRQGDIFFGGVDGAFLIGSLERSSVDDGRRLDARLIVDTLLGDLDAESVSTLHSLLAEFLQYPEFSDPDLDHNSYQPQIDLYAVAIAVVVADDPSVLIEINDYIDDLRSIGRDDHFELVEDLNDTETMLSIRIEATVSRMLHCNDIDRFGPLAQEATCPETDS